VKKLKKIHFCAAGLFLHVESSSKNENFWELLIAESKFSN